LRSDLYLFRGCLIPTRLPYLERSSYLVLDALEVPYEAMPGETCCVEPIGLRSLGVDTWLLSAARLLSIAESGDKDILTLCNGCAMSLQEANHLLQDREVRERTNAALEPIGREYQGTTRVLKLMEVLHQRKEKVKSLVTVPQDQLRVVAHPGCHLLRPSGMGGFDRPFRPRALSEMARVTGAEVAHSEDWPRCCGGTLSGVDDRLSSAILSETARSFQGSNANAILTPCPFCFFQFDVKQKGGLPVLFISELLALAFGIDAQRVGLQYHRIKAVSGR